MGPANDRYSTAGSGDRRYVIFAGGPWKHWTLAADPPRLRASVGRADGGAAGPLEDAIQR
jgi:hypothetical protein